VATRVGGFVSSWPRCGVEVPCVESLFMPELQPASMSSAVTPAVTEEARRFMKYSSGRLAHALPYSSRNGGLLQRITLCRFT
jgi:hypothetical protein